VSKFTASGTIGNSQIFDNGTNVGVGTASPSYLLDVNGTARVSGSAVFNTATNTSSIQDLFSQPTFAALYLDQTAPSLSNYAIASNGTNTLVNAASTSVILRIANSDRAVVYSNGNLSSGTSPADIGFSLNLTSAGSSGLIRAGNFTYGVGGRFVHFNYGDETQTSSNYSIYYELGDLIFNTKTGGVFKYRINNTDVGRIFTNGNFFIGSSPVDGGYKLDVLGTTRISGTELRLDNATTGVINLYSATPEIRFSVGDPTGYRIYRSSTNMIINSGGAIIQQIGGNSAYQIDATNGHLLRSAIAGGAALARLTTGGNFMVGTTIDVASAILQLNSTTKGFLPPRMTNAQMVAITSPATGLVVYDTTNNKLNVYDGTNWVAVH
jgi:hypothetical protein